MRAVNILLVEDDRLDAMDIQRTLEKMNLLFQLKVVSNGEQAMTYLQECIRQGLQRPDVVLIDINMPKMNGFELLEHLRADEYLKQLKCFMITTSDEDADRERAKGLGISGYIVKPLKLNRSSSLDALNLMIDLMNFQN